jgi:protein SCO1/2
VQVVFVSVDPARDTPEHLAQYVRYFDASFLAATAAPARLEALTRKLGVVAVAGEPDAAGSYEVDHTASILLLDPRARLVGIFGAPHVAEDITARFRAMRAHVEASS